jgi:hypothetical protein
LCSDVVRLERRSARDGDVDGDVDCDVDCGEVGQVAVQVPGDDANSGIDFHDSFEAVGQRRRIFLVMDGEIGAFHAEP